MSEVLLDMAMSLDGFSLDHNGKSLFPNEQLRGSSILTKMIHSTGAVIMDNEAYESADGNFIGYEYQVPIFVLADSHPDIVAKGENGKLKFYFITDGINQAVKKAKAVANGKLITIVGGIKAAQLAIEAGLVDLIKIRLINVIVGQGVRLFEHLSDQQIKLERVSTEEFSNRTDLCFKLTGYKYISETSTHEDNSPLMPGWLNKEVEGILDKGPLLNK